MTITRIVFSPTGGTERVADILANALGDKVVTVDLCDGHTDFSKAEMGDLAVIAMPCFCGRVPPLAARRLAGLQGEGTSAVVVAVYGNRAYDDLLVETADIAESVGFHVIAGVEAVAEHSIVHDYATGRPDESDEAQLRLFAAHINNKLMSASHSSVTLPGNRPYKEYKCGGMVPTANDACVRCGKCAEACPTGAIAMDDLKHADATLCMSCMRCIAVCPMGARAIDVERYEGIKAHLKEACSVRKEAALYI